MSATTRVLPRACRWWLVEPTPGSRDVSIALYRQADGTDAYVVVMSGDTFRLSRAGEFHYQPIPSSRTEEWIREHSFATMDEAVSAWMGSKS